MKIITKHLCPYCERINIGLNVRKIPQEIIHLEQIDSGVFPENLTIINPNKTFPTLQLSANSGFAESMIILEFIDSLKGEGPKLYGGSFEETAKIKFQIENIGNKITTPIQKCIFTFGSIIDERKALNQVKQAFNNFESILECRNSEFLGGNQLNAEDIHIAPFIMRYLSVNSYKPQLPLPEKESRVDLYFKAISQHPIIMNCVPNPTELSDSLKKYNAAKGLNIEKIKLSSRELKKSPEQSLKELNSLFDGINNFNFNGWRLSENEKGNFIYTYFNFQKPEMAIQTINLINEIQEIVNHHCNFTLSNLNSIKIELSTHEPLYGITDIDLSFAEFLTNRILSI